MKKIPPLDELRKRAQEPPAASEPAAAPAAAPATDDAARDVPEPSLESESDTVAASPAGRPSPDAAPAAGINRPSRSGRSSTSPAKQRQRRRYARERAVQALYQWDVGESSASDVRHYFLEQQDMSRADVEYFEDAFRGVTHDPEPLDALITPQLDRGFDELDPVERAVLRLSTWELQQRLDTPTGVIINEAVEVAKRFGAEQGHRFVNGVLDALAQQLRAHERRDNSA